MQNSILTSQEKSNPVFKWVQNFNITSSWVCKWPAGKQEGMW